MTRSKRALLVLVLGLALGVPALVALLAPGEPAHARNAKKLLPLVDAVSTAVAQGDRAQAKSAWLAFNDGWLTLEDPIRARDAAAYRKIEDRMFDVGPAVNGEGWNPSEAKAALADIRAQVTAVAALPAGGATEARPRADLATFRKAVADANAHPEAAAIDRCFELWGDVEPQVAARSVAAYGACETALAQARTAAAKKDDATARTALARIESELAPISGGRVGALDAAAILLREGAEALLVLIAVASYLTRLGAHDRVRYVWLGGAVGVVASLGVGALLVKIFTGVTAGAQREVVEGASSLTAAVLLVVVGWWLHAHVRRGGWKSQVEKALGRGSAVSLMAVAFLSVFREGAETVVFFAGIAPATTPRELVLGAVIGLAALVVLGVLIATLGKKVPLGTFFAIATALLWALAVKFVGAGVHALQAGGAVSQTIIAPIGEVPLLGFAPTLETCAAQAVALLAWLAFTLAPRLRRERRAARPSHPEVVAYAPPKATVEVVEGRAEEEEAAAAS